MKLFKSKNTSRGMTLVEILVVITIIVVLAGLGLAGYKRYRNSAKATSSISNLRNIGVMMATWGVDHDAAFPSIRGFDSTSGDKPNFNYWHWKLYNEAYSNNDQFVSDRKWAQSVIYNPAMKPEQVQNWTCGYAMNARLIENIENIGWSTAVARKLKLVAIPDMARAPIVAPRRDHHYRSAADLLYNEDGKTPILFGDGHVESMSRQEYEAKDYYNLFKNE